MDIKQRIRSYLISENVVGEAYIDQLPKSQFGEGVLISEKANIPQRQNFNSKMSFSQKTEIQIYVYGQASKFADTLDKINDIYQKFMERTSIEEGKIYNIRVTRPSFIETRQEDLHCRLIQITFNFEDRT